MSEPRAHAEIRGTRDIIIHKIKPEIARQAIKDFQDQILSIDIQKLGKYFKEFPIEIDKIKELGKLIVSNLIDYPDVYVPVISLSDVTTVDITNIILILRHYADHVRENTNIMIKKFVAEFIESQNYEKLLEFAKDFDEVIEHFIMCIILMSLLESKILAIRSLGSSPLIRSQLFNAQLGYEIVSGGVYHMYQQLKQEVERRETTGK